MGDCGLNCVSTPGSLILGSGNAKRKRKKKDKNYQKLMAPIRRTHICCICMKYPGDDHTFSEHGKKVLSNALIAFNL